MNTRLADTYVTSYPSVLELMRVWLLDCWVVSGGNGGVPIYFFWGGYFDSCSSPWTRVGPCYVRGASACPQYPDPLSTTREITSHR